MICPGCGKPYFFIHARERGRCLKCGYASEFELPAYTPAYHLEKYACDSGLYARTLKTDPLMRQILDSLNTGDGDSILEIGCGVGDYCGELSRFCDIIGVDISVQIAASRFGNRFLRASGERLPFRDNAFDKVVCVNVIEHVFDPAKLLSEISRVLGPGGTLALTTPDINSLMHHWTLDETHLHAWNRQEFEKLVTQFFDVTDIRRAGSLFKYYPLNLVLSKVIKPDLLAVCKKSQPQTISSI